MQDEDQTTADDQVDEPDQTDEATADEADDQEHDETAGKTALLADLAKARKQRNDARAEADQARTALAVARAQLVDQVITKAGYKPAGVRAGGLEDDTLFGDDGTLDPVAAKHAVTEIARDHGLTASKTGTVTRDRTPPSTGWQSALSGR